MQVCHLEAATTGQVDRGVVDGQRESASDQPAPALDGLVAEVELRRLVRQDVLLRDDEERSAHRLTGDLDLHTDRVGGLVQDIEVLLLAKHAVRVSHAGPLLCLIPRGDSASGIKYLYHI